MDRAGEQGEPGDPLHRQHEEGVHGQRLAHRARLQVPEGLHKLGVLGRELLQDSVLVDLVGAVLDVHLEVVAGVAPDDLGEAVQHDRLGPALLEVGEEPLGAGAHGDHVAEEDAVVPLGDDAGRGEVGRLDKVRDEDVEGLQVGGLRRDELKQRLLQLDLGRR